MGVWPPSKWGLKPRTRAYWPFWPRPAVLPRPEPTPRPLRVFLRVDPGGGVSLLRVSATVHLLHGHEVHHLLDGATEARRVVDHDLATRAAQAQPLHRRAHGVRLTDHALGLLHLQLRLHGAASCVTLLTDL